MFRKVMAFAELQLCCNKKKFIANKQTLCKTISSDA